MGLSVDGCRIESYFNINFLSVSNLLQITFIIIIIIIIIILFLLYLLSFCLNE